MTQNEKKIVYSSLPHILVVDDDERICDLVSRYLIKHNFVVMCANSASEAKTTLAHFSFDALIVDVMMPGESGLEFTQSIKNEKPLQQIPIIMLTALGEVDDRIAGFEAGVDDYLPKPFEARELLMRLEAILRRTRVEENTERVVRIGALVFDADGMALHGEEEVIKLTEMETRLLSALIEHDGEVVSRESLGEICDLEGGERAIDVQVTRLRRKIEPDSKMPRYLQTVRGKGYLLRAEILNV